VAGTKERGRASFSDGLGREFDGRAGFAPQCGRGLLGHADMFRSVEDLDVESAGTWMPGQLPLDQSGVANQQKPNLKMPRGNECPVNNAARGIIAAHGVNGYAHSEAVS
jgi:hypothetical protein